MSIIQKSLNIIPLNDIPKVYIEYETWEQIKFFVQECTHKECMWYNTIQLIENAHERYYYISNIYIPIQEVSSVTTETDPSNGLMSILSELRALHTDENGLNEIAFNETIESLGVWGHSHVKMGVSPSGTDEKTFSDFIENVKIPVMLIVNQNNEAYLRIVDKTNNLIYENLPIKILYNKVNYDYVKDALKEKIRNVQIVTKGHWHGTWHHKSTSINDPQKNKKNRAQKAIYLNQCEKVQLIRALAIIEDVPDIADLDKCYLNKSIKYKKKNKQDLIDEIFDNMDIESQTINSIFYRLMGFCRQTLTNPISAYTRSEYQEIIEKLNNYYTESIKTRLIAPIEPDIGFGDLPGAYD